ncbi:MAG: hypothetical protein R3F30_00100 [Planctomycetota bacterium]
MDPRALVAALLLGLTAPLGAQTLTTVAVPDDKPGSGTMNLAPLGGTTASTANLRTQIRVPAALLPAEGMAIKELGFCSSAVGGYTYASLTVTLAHLSGTSLSTTFADNLAGPVLVLQAKAITFAKADAWSLVKLDKAFDHDGRRDLVVDVVVQGASYAGTLAGTRRSDGTNGMETVYVTSYSTSKPATTGYGPYPHGARLALAVDLRPAAEVYGKGCADSDDKLPTIASGGAPAPGKPLVVRGTSGAATLASILALGGSATGFGPVRLPLDLGPFGAKGCSLLAEPLLLVPGSKGSGSFDSPAFTLPKDTTLVGLDLFAQWLLVEPKANTLGLVTSPGLRLRILR